MRRLGGLLWCGLFAATALGQNRGTWTPPSMLHASVQTRSLPIPSIPSLTQPENLLSFTPKDLRVVWNNRHWLLVAGDQILKDFGANEQEARQAHHLIQELGLNQHGMIGSSAAVMEYWLADGKAPQGVLRAGMRELSFDPAALRVEQVQGQWCLRDRSRMLFNFGSSATDAQQALGVIRKYHFDQVALVGQSAPSMYVFMSRSPQGASSLPLTHGAGASGRQLTTPRFTRVAKNSDGSPRIEKPSTPGTAEPLAGVAVAAVPPLANHTRDRMADQPRAFQWQTRPQMGQSPPVSPNGDRVPFDWRRVSLQQEQGEWRLKAGNHVLANFGTSIQDARLALTALRYYRFTEQHRLGGEQSYLTYFVANGAAPRGLLPGIVAEDFKPEQLELKQVETGFALCQGKRVIVRLRDREDDGRKLLDSIKRQRCDRVCRIGEPGKEAMTFLVRSR